MPREMRVTYNLVPLTVLFLRGKMSESMRSFDEQWEILIRGIDSVVPEADFRKKLERAIASNTPLRVKYGIDPTGIDVHLGHTVPLRKLRQFQDLGHTAVIIIGDYTAMVGDPSGRDAARAGLTREQVEANAKDYLKQVGRIIDLGKAEIHSNGDWFGKWAFLDVLRLMQRTTIGKITAREDFAKRLKEEKPVYLSECLYPLMQGWDSVEIRADVELGGTEQLFNLLVGRDLQQEEGQSAQVAMTLPILVGTDGTRRMGKSLGNYIGVGEDAATQFGKIMSLPDAPMRQYFTLLTDVPIAEVDRLLSAEVNPRDAKEALGRAIVAQYHGLEGAEEASKSFRLRARGLQANEEIPSKVILSNELDADGCMLPGKLLHALDLAASGSQGSALVLQGAVRIGAEASPLERDRKKPIKVTNGLIVRVGKGNKTKAARVDLVPN